MNIKIVYAFLGFLFGVLIALVPTIYNALFVPSEIPIVFKDVIPDEATATRVAEAILDTYYGTEYKVGTGLDVVFIEHENAWGVYFWEESLERSTGFSSAGLPMIFLRKDNGMVLSIGLQQD